MKGYLLLLGSILSEVVATTALKYSHGFTKPLPTVVVAIGYGIAFYLLSLTLKYLPLGLAYAIWSGLGTAAAVLISVLLFKDQFKLIQLAGVAFVLVGVVLLNMGGKS